MPAEIEIKLNIGAEALQKLLASPLVADKIIGGTEAVHHLETSYYDTPSFKLMHSGIAYRVRKNGDKYEATIKTEKEAHGGVFPAATNIMLICRTASLFCRDLKKLALIPIWKNWLAVKPL